MYTFRPRPGPVEREALRLALERLLGKEKHDGRGAYASEWRRAALDEGVSSYDDDDEPGR